MIEITKEVAEQIQLNEDQIKGLNEILAPKVADLKKEWDGLANKNAENILSDVSRNVERLTGIKKTEGEKYADYLRMASEGFLTGQKAELERQKADLEEKIKSGSDEMTKKELEKARTELATVKTDIDKYKDKAAKFDDWEANDYKGKYEQTIEALTKTQERVAFQSVKPTFPDTVNKYEASAKWNEFIIGVKESHRIVEENGEYYAIDKDNEHKKFKLSVLVEKDKAITELAKGREVTGLGSKGKEKQIEGVPFKVEEGATRADIAKSVKDYILNDLKLSFTSPDYARKYSELYTKITAQQTA